MMLDESLIGSVIMMSYGIQNMRSISMTDAGTNDIMLRMVNVDIVLTYLHIHMRWFTQILMRCSLPPAHCQFF